MSAFAAPPLDFDVIREIWGKYELADHSFLKVKVVLTEVTKAQSAGAGQPSQPQYSLGMQNISIVLTNERGQPDARNYSHQELQAAMVKDDIRFTTMTQDWNEYVVDDGTRIRIQPMLMKVSKTSKFNAKGAPIYLVEVSATVQIKTPPSAAPAPSSPSPPSV